MAIVGAPLLPNRQLTGTPLLVGRACWVALASLALVALVLGSVNVFRDYSNVCAPVRLAECVALERLGLAGMARYGLASYALASVLLIAIPWTVMGWLVFLRKSATAGELVMALGLAVGWASDLCANVIPFHFFREVALRPALLPLAFSSMYVLSLTAQVAVVVMAYLMPAGRFLSRWSVALAVVWFVHVAINVLHRYPFGMFQGVPIVSALDTTFTFVAPLSAVFTVWYRYRFVARGLARAQLKAILPSAVTLVLVYGFFTLWTLRIWSGPDGETFTPLRFGVHFLQSGIVSACAAWFAVSVGIAILRYNMFGLDLFLDRALVYGGLGAGLGALYLVIVLGVGGALGADGKLWLPLVATASIALLFEPLRARLKRGVSRLLYGERGPPSYEVLTRLSHQTQAGVRALDLLPAFATTIRSVLKVPYVAVSIDSGSWRQAVRAGQAGLDLKRFPLLVHGKALGWLDVSLRHGELLDEAEHRLLEAIADQIALVAQSFQLASDLQEARKHLVTTREEERLRLRRDLHDGLGPGLAAQSLIIGSARRLVRSDPNQADRLLGELQASSQGMLETVRQLVYSLRPPDLDQLGLVDAIRRRAEHLAQGGIRIDVLAPTEALACSPAAEVAVYRIVTEALTNVVRHARATACTVALRLDAGGIEVSVGDDGVGFERPGQGVGLGSMRDRAEELGGTFSATPRPPPQHGTVVRAWLPGSEPPSASTAAEPPARAVERPS